MESEFDTTILKLIKEQILSNPESLYLNDLIGIGTIGKVYKIKIPNEKQVFALKVISKNFHKNFITPYINFFKKLKILISPNFMNISKMIKTTIL